MERKILRRDAVLNKDCLDSFRGTSKLFRKGTLRVLEVKLVDGRPWVNKMRSARRQEGRRRNCKHVKKRSGATYDFGARFCDSCQKGERMEKTGKTGKIAKSLHAEMYQRTAHFLHSRREYDEITGYRT